MELIIDGNAFINVAMSVTKSMDAINHRTEVIYYTKDLFKDEYRLLERFENKFRDFSLIYLNSMLAPLGSNLSGVHIVFDSPSWRKKYIESFFEKTEFTKSGPVEFTYKSGRKYDDYQYLFFNYFYQKLIPALEKCKVQWYSATGAEGDDIIAHLCETIPNDIMIYSVDKDLKQLVSSIDKNIILIMPKQQSPHKKIFVSSNGLLIHESKVENDFFSLDEMKPATSPVESIISSFVNKDYVKYETGQIVEIFNKICLGDKSDKIPKIFKMSPIKVEKIINSLLEEFGDDLLSKLDSLNEEFITYFVDQIVIVNKITDPVKIGELREHLVFNIKITRLASSVFPEELQNNLKKLLVETSVFNIKEFTNFKNNPELI